MFKNLLLVPVTAALYVIVPPPVPVAVIEVTGSFQTTSIQSPVFAEGKFNVTVEIVADEVIT